MILDHLFPALLLAAAPTTPPAVSAAVPLDDGQAGLVALVDRHLTAYNARDLDAFMACWAPDAELLEFPDKSLAKGTAALRARYAARMASPNLHADVVQRIAVGGRIIDHEHVTLTFPEGPGTLEAVLVYEFRGGLIARAWLIPGPRVLDRKP
jgi:hypothetical protein